MGKDWSIWYWVVAPGLVALGTMALAFVTAFQDKIRSWVMQPKINISIQLAPPDCHKAVGEFQNKRGEIIARGDCYYFRLRIENTGNTPAELAEVFAAKLSKKQADGTFRMVRTFLPMNLVWSHYRTTLYRSMSPRMPKHCDLGHIIDPKIRPIIVEEEDANLGLGPEQTVFSLDLIVRPAIKSYLVPPGIYELEIVAAAANAKPIKKTLQINHTGNWFDDEPKMLSEGIGIQLL